MADKSIAQLNEAEKVYSDNLFVLHQAGEAKKLSGNTLKNWLLEIANSLGGISKIEKVSTSGLKDTYRIYYAKDGTTTDFTVTNGEKGDKGDNSYIWIRYTGQKPTESSHSFGTDPDDWMGIYAGKSATAPTDYKDYTWFKIKGEKGDTGDAATVKSRSVTYQLGSSGTTAPSGSWLQAVPSVPQGQFLWTKTDVTFNTGDTITWYSVSRMGIDGTGAVSTVCRVDPDRNGNVSLSASDVGALATSGGEVTGDIAMSGKKVTGLGAPSDDADAASKSYVDTSLTNVKTVSVSAALTVAGWTGSAPYVQSVTITDLTDAKKSMAYPVYGSNTATNLALKEACGMVSFASRSGSTLTFTCLEDKPTVGIPITVEVYV